MSDRPTPETDAQIRNQNDAFDDWEKYRLTIIFARKLERERDEAREEAERYRLESNMRRENSLSIIAKLEELGGLKQ